MLAWGVEGGPGRPGWEGGWGYIKDAVVGITLNLHTAHPLPSPHHVRMSPVLCNSHQNNFKNVEGRQQGKNLALWLGVLM